MENFLRTLPVAHRGLHLGCPENSVPAFRAAMEKGYAIETDVHFTKDRMLAVFHDDNLLRMTGIDRFIGDCTMRELKRLSLGGTEERIPELREILKLVDGQVPLLIEIKNMPQVAGKEIAAALGSALARYRGVYAIQSFNPFYVRAYKKMYPEIPCGILAQKKMAEKGDSFKWRMEARLLSRLRLNFLAKPDFVSYGLEGLPVRRFVKFKGARLVWTVQSEEDEHLARTYADNIIFEGFLPEIK